MTEPCDLDSDTDCVSEVSLEIVQQRFRGVSIDIPDNVNRRKSIQLSNLQPDSCYSHDLTTGLSQQRDRFDRGSSGTLSPEPRRLDTTTNNLTGLQRSAAPSPNPPQVTGRVNRYEPTVDNDRPRKQTRVCEGITSIKKSSAHDEDAVDSMETDEEDDTRTTHYQEVVCRLKSHGKQAVAEIYDLTQEEEEEAAAASDNDDVEIVTVIPRNANASVAARPCETLSRYTIKVNEKDFHCTPSAPDKGVELNDGTFMRIATINKDSSGAVTITGPLFKRHNSFPKSKWPRRHNELVQMVEKRKEEFSSRKHDDSFPDIRQDIEVGPLFCRWKQTDTFDDKDKLTGEIIEKLSANAANLKGRRSDLQVRQQWRKHLVDAADKRQGSRAHSTRQTLNTFRPIPYTFGDTFCGGGGASSAAHEAGLRVKFGIDLNEAAMKTYTTNFESKGTQCIQQDIHDFITWSKPGEHLVDVLHMSPPCQPFSPAHTIHNLIRDEANEAALFAVGELLQKLRPRVATLEQTFGLHRRHPDYFNALIKMFLDVGYSLHWRVMSLEGYGLPQTRKRLIIIAAGPGEALPSFPELTHSATNRLLKKLCTIGEKIDSIPVGTKITHHNIKAAMYHPNNCKPSYSPDQLAKTITTSGGIGNYHPSGMRGFTMRELATLQMFPLSYKFAEVGVTALRRQIGNAVPPYVFKKINREIIKSLNKTDSLQ